MALPADDPETQARLAAFAQGLQQLGWTVGQNVRVDYRWGHGNADAQRNASELVALGPDVILAHSSGAVTAVLQTTRTIPIVFTLVADPVGGGYVESLAHPGGNVTGFASFEYSIGSEWLRLLKEVSPDIRHFAVIFHPNTTPGGWLPLIKAVAPLLGLEVNEVAVNDDSQIDGAIDALKTSSDAGVIVLPSSFTRLHRQRIIDFAARLQLPAVYWDSRFVKDGGLISYAYSLDEEERQGATYVDRILKGEKAGDLPVQETKKIELVINLKTAKALGLTIPSSVLARADEVIE